MLKLFGAGLTMFSCFAAGCLICAEMKKRIHILEELRRHDGYAFGGNWLCEYDAG